MRFCRPMNIGSVTRITNRYDAGREVIPACDVGGGGVFIPLNPLVEDAADPEFCRWQD